MHFSKFLLESLLNQPNSKLMVDNITISVNIYCSICRSFYKQTDLRVDNITISVQYLLFHCSMMVKQTPRTNPWGVSPELALEIANSSEKVCLESPFSS